MNLIVISLAIAAVSTTICLTYVFRWLRILLEPVPVIGKLIKCPYCLNFYLAFAAVFVAVDVESYQEWIFLSLAAVTLSSMFGYILLKYLDLLEG